jgi:hypothetical protein
VGVHPSPLQALELAVVLCFDDLLEPQALLRVLLDILDDVEGVFVLFPLLDGVHQCHLRRRFTCVILVVIYCG